jgi:predicted hotdog family 3-hydroxylacyl-ACP dehydratase
VTRLPIPPDLAWFDGHFPGRPLLPGVAQLAMVDDLLRAQGRALAGFARLRFRREVLPGEDIEIEIREDAGDGTARFAVSRGGEATCDGIALLRAAGTGASGRAAGPQPPPPDATLAPAEALVPHRGAMRFVEALVASSPAATTALARVPAGSPFARDGFAPAVLAIEMAAQTAAAGEALARSRATGVAGPREGRLVGASDVSLLAEAVPEGRLLVVSIVLAQSVPPMAIYEATIADGDHVLATGRVNTYLV